MLNKLLKLLGKLSSPHSVILENISASQSQSTLDELLNAKARLRAIYNSSFDAISILGDKGFIDGNTAALALFGCATIEEFSRYSPVDLSPATQACGTDSKTLAQYYIDLTLNNGYCRFEWLHQRADNSVVFETEVLLSSLVIDGVTHIQCVQHDLTTRRKAAASLAKKKKKIKALKAAKDCTEDLAKTKSQFLANLSNDIRTPITEIIGFSDLALLEKDPQKTDNYFQNINTTSKHLLAILNDTVDVSMLDIELMTLQLTHFNLADLGTMLHGLFINTAQEKGLTLTINIENQVPEVLIGDSLRLRHVLINLLGNALKFTQQGSVTLNISLLQLDANVAQLLFTISYAGMGISTEQQELLFHPFSEVDDGYARNFEGTALGLSISQDLVQLMGGSIKLDSHPGLGSCFSFELWLPLGDLATIESQITPSLKPESLSGARILLVEDDAFTQMFLTELLQRFGASIVLANNGLEALAALEIDRFDIVLMDLRMPIMDGYQATLAIRKRALYAQLPVIAFSANVSDEEKRLCIATGMNDFVAKPINKKELLAALKPWLKH